MYYYQSSPLSKASMSGLSRTPGFQTIKNSPKYLPTIYLNGLRFRSSVGSLVVQFWVTTCCRELSGLMGTKIIHFGIDDCRRLPVLEHAGYEVEDCNVFSQLMAALQRRELTAIVFADDRRAVPEVAHLARIHSSAPMVLFQSPSGQYDAFQFDLVIPTLTPPAEWLNSIAETIERSRILVSKRHVFGKQTAELEQDIWSSSELQPYALSDGETTDDQQEVETDYRPQGNHRRLHGCCMS